MTVVANDLRGTLFQTIRGVQAADRNIVEAAKRCCSLRTPEGNEYSRSEISGAQQIWGQTRKLVIKTETWSFVVLVYADN